MKTEVEEINRIAEAIDKVMGFKTDFYAWRLRRICENLFNSNRSCLPLVIDNFISILQNIF